MSKFAKPYAVINITTEGADVFPTKEEAIVHLKVVRSRGYTAFLARMLDLNEENAFNE